MAIRGSTIFYEYTIGTKQDKCFEVSLTNEDAKTLSKQMCNMDHSLTFYCQKTGNVKLAIRVSEIVYIHLKENN